MGGASDAALASWHALGLRYGTAYVYPKSALAAGDKAAFHALAASCSTTGYAWTASDSPDEVVAKAARLRFPLMVKPVDGSGSKGVTHVARCDDLPAAVACARSYSASRSVIAEEFVQSRPLAMGGEAASPLLVGQTRAPLRATLVLPSAEHRGATASWAVMETSNQSLAAQKKTAAATSSFSVFALEPFPELQPDDDLVGAITDVLARTGAELEDGDIVVVASKVVSIAEKRYIDLASVTVGPEALELSAKTGKPASIVQLILDHSVAHFLATEKGPIIAQHRLGYQLTSAGIDRAGTEGAWLLPVDPDASARALRDALITHTSAEIAVVIADSDGRADRRGATCISIGAAGLAPLRITEHTEPAGRAKRQEETFTDMVAAAAGIVLGQRGRGAPVAVLRGINFTPSDEGVASMIHRGR
ncbi:coenzyme F420-0:L-glutamate ligase [Streptomyces lydicus]|uniref:coenzyme F420-0:L-glutamate ligase n=1 Tax=Streptomyces lydicus TaxID=47763 RepID=UPI0037B44F36